MTQGDNLLYKFGLYSLDVHERVLTREGGVVPLTPKAFEMLLVLVRNSGHVVTKDDLIKAVWPDAFVEEANSYAEHLRATKELISFWPGRNRTQQQ